MKNRSVFFVCSPSHSLIHVAPMLQFEFMEGTPEENRFHRVMRQGMEHPLVVSLNDDILKLMFLGVKNNIYSFILNPYGSVVICNLFDGLDAEERSKLVSDITLDICKFKDVCLDTHGSESIKKLIDCCVSSSELLSSLTSAFKRIIVSLVNNEIGASIIQHFFNIFPVQAAEAEPILGALGANIKQIATSRHGSNILKVVFSVLPFNEGQTSIFEGLMYHLDILLQDPFGSEIFQQLAGVQEDMIQEWIICEMKEIFLIYSMNQYASQVVKKLIELSGEAWANIIIFEIVNCEEILKPMILQNKFVFSVLRLAKKYAAGGRLNKVKYLLAEHARLSRKRKKIVYMILRKCYVVAKLRKITHV